MTDEQTYTLSECEAAMCMWEAVTDAIMKGCPMHNAFIDASEGTASARLVVMGWAADCCAEFDKAQSEGVALEPFDWEHCPAYVQGKLSAMFPDLA